jgi:hypothetical protein
MSILLALMLAAEAAGPNVTLPLEEYEKLRQLRERPSVTVVDLLRIDGTFGRRDLSVSIQGRASGTLPTTEVLGGEGFRLFGCSGEALVTRAESGRFALTPLAPRFEARCRIALDGSDRLEATALPAVLDVASTVADGELVASGGAGERPFSIVRRLGGSDAVLPPSIAGRYKVTLLPEETRFQYRFEVRNPNRGRHRFAIPLREAEHVESVDAPVAWDKDAGGYRFDLPPGESAIELTGRLTGDSFAPPIDASLQYLLLESHPLIRAEVAGATKRVGAGEVGLPATYRGAQAFLLDGRREVTWKTVRMEALKTAGLSIAALEQVWFLGASGEVRGETRLSIENQGAPAVELPLQGEATFAAIDGEPTFLTRNESGNLFLPLAQGPQTVVVQTKRVFGGALGFAGVSLELPQLGVPASRAEFELRYPREWTPVYEELTPESRVRPADGLLRVVILLVLVERSLAILRLSVVRRWALSAAVAVAGALSMVVAQLALFAVAAIFAARVFLWLKTRYTGVRLGVAAAVTALGAWAVLEAISGGPRMVGREESAHVYSESESYGLGNVMKRVGPQVSSPSPDDLAAALPARAAPAAGDYRGLPAQIAIPAGKHQTTFTRELLSTDTSRRAFVLLVSSRMVTLVTWLAALGVLGLGILSRAELASCVRGFVARLREPVPALEPKP